MPFLPTIIRKIPIALMTLVLMSSVSCAKKHSRGRPDEIRITAGHQTGGTEPQGGMGEVTGGQGGEDESTGGNSGNQGGTNTGGTNTGGTSGNDTIGGTGGAPIALPIAGQTGGNVGDGGMVLFPEGGSGGGENTAGVMVVEPAGGNGGDEAVMGGFQSEGGQGGDGGELIPEPEPRELRYAPTPWPMSTELGLQTITDFESCGNVPFVDLQPMFEPVIDERMDLIDPDTGQREANHWVYKGPAGFVNRPQNSVCDFRAQDRNVVMFSWQASRAGKYTFQVSNQVFSRNVPEITIQTSCADRGTTLACSNPRDANIGTPELPASSYRNIMVDLEDNQKVFALVEIEPVKNEPRYIESPLFIQVFRSEEGGLSEPVLEELSVKRYEGGNDIFIQFEGYDADADVLSVEIQLVRDAGGEVIAPFLQEREIDEDEGSWFSLEPPSHPVFRRTIFTRNTWGIRDFYSSVEFETPRFLFEQYSHVRIRLVDHEGHRSNAMEAPVETYPDREVPDVPCINGWDCAFGNMCRYVPVDENGQEEGRCLMDRPPAQMTASEAWKNDDGVYLSMGAESLSHDFAMFHVELLDDEGGVVFEERYVPVRDTNRYAAYYYHADLQTEFARDIFIPFVEIGTYHVTSARIVGREFLAFRELYFLSEIEPVEIEVLDMEELALGDVCEPGSMTSSCPVGSLCTELDDTYVCQETELPSISNISGYFYNRAIPETALVHFDTEDDILGYRVRGVEHISPDQVFYIDHISKDQEPYRGHIRHAFEGDMLQNGQLDELEFQVIARNGYSSDWYRIQLEQAIEQQPKEPSSPCFEVICEEDFYCQEAGGQDMGECIPRLPPEPDIDLCENVQCEANHSCIERGEPAEAVCVASGRPTVQVADGVSMYNPKSKVFVMEGILELPDFEITYREPYSPDRIDGEFIFYNAEGVVIDRISSIRNGVESSVRKKLEVDRVDESHYAFRLERYLDVKRELYGESLSQVAHVQWIHRGLRVFDEPPFLTPFSFAPQRLNGELCDPNGVNDYCEPGNHCETIEAEPRCTLINNLDVTCEPNMLNADLNWFEIEDESAPRGVRWEIPGAVELVGTNHQSTGSCHIPNDIDNFNIIPNPVHVFRFQAPVEDEYVFLLSVPQYNLQDDIFGARMWIRSHCSVPEAELDCQEGQYWLWRQHPESGERQTFEEVSSVLHLEEDQVVYVFVTRRTDDYDLPDLSEYFLSVSHFEPNIVVDPVMTESHVARLNPATGKVLFEVELEGFGTLPHLGNVHLEYQPLSENGDVIPLERIDGGDPLEPQKLQRVSDRDELLFQSEAGRLSLSDEQLLLITHFRVWLVRGDGRSEPLVLEAELPGELYDEVNNFCDPSGIANSCPDENACIYHRRFENETTCHSDYFNTGLNDRFRCSAPTDSCPIDVCQEGWNVRPLGVDAGDPNPAAPTHWSVQGDFLEQDPQVNEYDLNGGCSREGARLSSTYQLTLNSNAVHAYSFEATSPGTYRFYFSEDTTLQRGLPDESGRLNYDALVLSVRDDCMFSRTELGCGGGTLNGEHYDITIDLTENQTVFIHVSHYDPGLVTPWPYTLQVERVR